MFFQKVLVIKINPKISYSQMIMNEAKLSAVKVVSAIKAKFLAY
jgi:hypothetical protein